MDPSSAQLHHQDLSSQTLESMLVCTKAQQDKKPRPPEALKCPRCDSTNTKFCYYNNYSLTQPRYFCKSCRRYWTKGGTLRNVPVGGGCRKNKRSSSSSSSSKRGQDPSVVAPNANPLSSLTGVSYDSDISLAITRLQKQSNDHLGFDLENDHLSMLGNPNNPPHCEILGSHGRHAGNGNGFFDALRGGFLENHNNGLHHHHHLYYGMSNNGTMGGGLESINDGDQEMSMMPYEETGGGGGATTTATTVTTVKQEICNARDGESRVLWRFPWQIGGGEASMGGLDSGRQSSWNNGFGGSWHGLLNSAPLM